MTELQTDLRKKIDVTDKVIGKFHGDRVTLYLNNRVIGTMNLDSPQSPEFVFHDGYGLEGNRRIYQVQEVGVNKEYYVEGCDLGWC